MTKQEHWDAYRAHWRAGMAALHVCTETRAFDAKWQEYKAEMLLANKHYGIVRRMKNGRLNIGGQENA